jgi:hypothetical protein
MARQWWSWAARNGTGCMLVGAPFIFASRAVFSCGFGPTACSAGGARSRREWCASVRVLVRAIIVVAIAPRPNRFMRQSLPVIVLREQCITPAITAADLPSPQSRRKIVSESESQRPVACSGIAFA